VSIAWLKQHDTKLQCITLLFFHYYQNKRTKPFVGSFTDINKLNILTLCRLIWFWNQMLIALAIWQ